MSYINPIYQVLFEKLVSIIKEESINDDDLHLTLFNQTNYGFSTNQIWFKSTYSLKYFTDLFKDHSDSDVLAAFKFFETEGKIKIEWDENKAFFTSFMINPTLKMN